MPENVFIKNRLIRKEHQEKLLWVLLKNSELFNSFYNYTKYPDILTQFVKYPAMKTILDVLKSAQLLNDMEYNRYIAVSMSYCKDGFKGLLRFELDRAKKGAQTIDKAYMNAFRTQKDLIEHKFPKLLLLFESIFICAATMKGISIEGFSLSKVARFYETGVKSYLGEQLIEYGFPVDAIKEIESKHPDLIICGASKTNEYVTKNKQSIVLLLDEYEKYLFEKAIKLFV